MGRTTGRTALSVLFIAGIVLSACAPAAPAAAPAAEPAPVQPREPLFKEPAPEGKA
jgi:hypothetical protein